MMKKCFSIETISVLQLFITVCVLVLSVSAHDHDDDDDDDDHATAFWATVGGYAVLGIMVLIGCGLFGLFAWCCCSIHTKLTHNKVAGGVPMSGLPIWSRSLMMNPAYQSGGFCHMSDGFRQDAIPNKIVRWRSGTAITDGARWGPPLVAGKHVFEVVWPWGCRGTNATVGIERDDAPLTGKGPVSMVGNCKHSWGLDIVKRRVLHNKKMTKICPNDGSYVPDRFFMFVDMDQGMLGFGSDVTFWGFPIEGIPVDSSKPLHVAVSSCKYMAEISVFYRGSACYSNNGFDIFPQTTASAPVAPGPSMDMPPAYAESSTKGVTTIPVTPGPAHLYNEPPPPYVYYTPASNPTAPSFRHQDLPSSGVHY